MNLRNVLLTAIGLLLLVVVGMYVFASGRDMAKGNHTKVAKNSGTLVLISVVVLLGVGTGLALASGGVLDALHISH